MIFTCDHEGDGACGKVADVLLYLFDTLLNGVLMERGILNWYFS